MTNIECQLRPPYQPAHGISVPVKSEADIITARQSARRLAATLGFERRDSVLIATAVSELARNILLYAKQGAIVIRPTYDARKAGVTVTARDLGPGIPDLAQAMQDGYSTSGGSGLGLSGTKRLMDEFKICSVVGKGTTVTVKKWISQAGHWLGNQSILNRHNLTPLAF